MLLSDPYRPILSREIVKESLNNAWKQVFKEEVSKAHSTYISYHAHAKVGRVAKNTDHDMTKLASEINFYLIHINESLSESYHKSKILLIKELFSKEILEMCGERNIVNRKNLAELHKQLSIIINP